MNAKPTFELRALTGLAPFARLDKAFIAIVSFYFYSGELSAVSGYRAAERGNNNHPTKYQSPAHQGTLAQNRTILHAINKNMMYLWRL